MFETTTYYQYVWYLELVTETCWSTQKTQQDPTSNSPIAAPSPTRTKIKVQDWVQEHQAS